MATPGSGFWSFGSEDGSGDPENPGTARAWCQVAQKFTGGIGNKLCALLYGDSEKPAESGGSQPARATSRKATCACNQKPCSCPKADVNYAFLHATDLLPACDGERPTLAFLQDVMGILLQYVVKSFDRSTKVIDFHYPNELLQEYNWELADQPQNLEEILMHCQTTLKYAIKTGHPRYFNQLSTGLDMVGLAADWLTSTANTNMFTYEIAPVFVLLEYVTLKKMREIIGWPGGSGDGIFSPGGAISNMYAMLIARFKMFPEVKEKGMAAVPRLIAFTSEHVRVSVLSRFKGLMQSCNQMHASYLFQQDKHYDLSYDTGDKALQCGRHVDVFKLWLMWRAKGTTGFEAHIDKCLELAEYLYNIIKNREGYEMVFDGKPQHTNVCFWYVPPSLRVLEDNEERMSRLSKVAPVIKARMMEYGTTMVSYQPLGDKVNFFRMVISNPAATHQDIDFLIEEIERLGQDL
uniref:glutamate decarboxylase 2 n=1 Tax=Panthera onca TaxID=9690 RepID=UPI0029542BB7|nr:glutamate decarboxylase 2 [Panthera onca]